MYEDDLLLVDLGVVLKKASYLLRDGVNDGDVFIA